MNDNKSKPPISIDMSEFSSEKLADIIVSYRYLGLYEEIAKTAMERLADRRIQGDNFEYEKYISEKLETLPKIQFKIPATQSNSLFNFLKTKLIP